MVCVTCTDSVLYVLAPASVSMRIESVSVNKFVFTSRGFLFCTAFVAGLTKSRKAMAVDHGLGRQLEGASSLSPELRGLGQGAPLF